MSIVLHTNEKYNFSEKYLHIKAVASHGEYFCIGCMDVFGTEEEESVAPINFIKIYKILTKEAGSLICIEAEKKKKSHKRIPKNVTL